MATRARLTKASVVQAAVELINEEGANALSLHRLADKLDIRTPSLYNHIDGLPGLQRELAVMNARLIADRLSAAAIGKSGEELFMNVAQAFRDYVKDYPGLYLSTLRSSGRQDIRDENLMHEEDRAVKVGLAVMASFGLRGEDGIHALRAFRSMIHGFATLEVAGGFGMPEDCDESFRRMVQALAAGLRRG
jgi:AcrR family transcriptional regulator